MRVETRAFALTVLGGALWGLSGTAAQALFDRLHFPVPALILVRTPVAGGILYALLRPAFPRRRWGALVLFSVFGLLGSQVTYLFTIGYTNAATATLLQFLFLPMVAAYELAVGRLKLSPTLGVTLVMAVAGTFLLIAGTPAFRIHLVITPLGLAFGLLSALCGVYYTLGSQPLVREYGPWPVTTWGFLVATVLAVPIGLPSMVGYVESRPPLGLLPELLGLVLFVIVAGTLLAYGLYLQGLGHLTATENGLASTSEPIMAAAASFLFLGVVLSGLQYVGGAVIVVGVALLARTLAASPAATAPPPIERPR